MSFLKWVIFLILLAAGLSLLMWYFHIEPVFGIVQTGFNSLPTIDLNNLSIENVMGYAGVAGVSVTALGGVYKYLKEKAAKLNILGQLNATKEQASNTLQQASAEIAAKESTVKALIDEKTALQSNTQVLTDKITELEASATPMQNQILDLQRQLEQARQQLTGLSKMNVDNLGQQVAQKLAESQRVP